MTTKTIVVLGIVLPFCILGQCPTTAFLSANTKCIKLNYPVGTNPIPTPVTYNGVNYNLVSGTSYEYKGAGEMGNCPTEYKGQLTGTLTVNGVLCTFSGGVLPIKEENLTISQSGRVFQIAWEGYSDAVEDEIRLEKSVNGKTWQTLMTYDLFPDRKTSWKYTDYNQASGMVYYRLQTVDVFGKSTFSPVKAFDTHSSTLEEFLYPNPGNDWIYFQKPMADESRILIFNTTGQQVRQAKVASQGIDISSLTPGMYTLVLQDKPEEVFRFVKE